MAVNKSSKPVAAGVRKPRRLKWMVLGVLALGVVIAAQAGYVGYGWAHLKAKAFPQDESLLGYVPGDAAGVLLIDPHQIDPKALGGDGSAARQWLGRTRTELQKATGIDLLFDVDKLAFAPTMVVLRGRFDARQLNDHLTDARYVAAEYKGHAYLVRAGEDAIAVVDGDVVLYGDEASIRASFDAKQDGLSLQRNDDVLARLKSAGWDHPILLTVRLANEKPSIRSILTGAAGPRAVTIGLKTLAGLDLTAAIESASAASADELKKLLEEKRASAETMAPLVGPAAATILVDVAKKATIANQETFVRIQLHVDPAQLDALITATGGGAAIGEAYKTLRLFQLLTP